jgi:O-antigen/teichoic acid export membrane protein
MGILPSQLLGFLGPAVTAAILAIYDPSLKSLGVLGTAMLLTSPLTVIMHAFNNAYQPIYFSVRKKGDRQGLRNLAVTGRHVWTASVGLCLAAALFGPPAVRIMMDVRYHEAAVLMPILALVFILQITNQLLATEIYFAKKTKLLPLMSALSVATNIGVAVWAAPIYGGQGVAWAYVASIAVLVFLGVWFSRRTMLVPYPWLGMAGPVVLAAAIFGASLIFRDAGAWVLAGVALGGVSLYVGGLAMFADPTWRAAWSFARGMVGRSGR